MRLFRKDGFQTVRSVFGASEIAQMLAHSPDLGKAAGSRNLLSIPFFRTLSVEPRITALVVAFLGARSVCVRGIMFDKNPQANWVLGFHQDTKIAVKSRQEVPGYRLWSMKKGVAHCLPPSSILENMVALRIALDPADESNGALLCIPGTHKLGLLSDEDVNKHSAQPAVVCDCDSGDVVAMHSLTLHASSKSVSPSHRRVLHFEYCSARLEPPLEWAFA